MLYQVDLRHADWRQIVEEFWQGHTPTAEVKQFANQLVEGTIANLPQIDPLIANCAEHWNLKRMAVIDRNILRLGAYELLCVYDVPPKVCINEAIELAKRFGDTESSKFVNGILDAIHKHRVSPAPSS